MPRDPEVRARYLSFGLFAQKIVDALIEFADEGKAERLTPALEEAIAFLTDPSKDVKELPKKVRAFRSYEHIRTLEEVCPEVERRGQVVRLLQDLKERHGSPRELRKKANHAIDFFYALENRALRNSGQPEPLPRGIRELCRV